MPDSGPNSKRTGWRVVGAVIVAVLLAVGTVVWLRPITVYEFSNSAHLWLAGVHGYNIEVDGRRIHYLEGGAGPPVVLIHGLGSRASAWTPLMTRLVRSGFHVYALDLLGYGESERPADAPYSISEESALVEHFLDEKGLRGVHMAGWSMGGWVAASVALDRPDLVDRLVLCDSAGLRFNLPFDPSIFEPHTVDQLNAFYDLLLPAPVRMPGFLAHDILRHIERGEWVVHRAMTSMLSGKELLDDRLGELRIPVLIVWGRQDHLIPLDTALSFHRRIPQSNLAIFDGCGHLAPGQCASAIVPRVVDFLSANPAPVGTMVQVSANR